MKKHISSLYRLLFAAALLMSSTMSAWSQVNICWSTGEAGTDLDYGTQSYDFDTTAEYFLYYVYNADEGQVKYLTYPNPSYGGANITWANKNYAGENVWFPKDEANEEYQLFKLIPTGEVKTCGDNIFRFYQLYNKATNYHMPADWWKENENSFAFPFSKASGAILTQTKYEVVILMNKSGKDNLSILMANPNKYDSYEVKEFSYNPYEPVKQFENRSYGYFVLEKNCHTVHYNANGGDNAPDDDEEFCLSGNISSTIPTRQYYLFTGWNTAADGTGTTFQPGDPLTLTKDTTLYAQWIWSNFIGISAHRWDDDRLVFTTEDEVPTDFDAITINYNGNAYSTTQSKSGSYYMVTASSLNLSAQSYLPFNIQWKKDGDVMKQATIKSPIFVLADSTNLNWSSEILASAYIKVATGATLNLTDDYTIGDVDISEGAKLRVEGATLAAGHMHLRGGLIDEYNYLMPQVYVGSDASVTTNDKQIYYYLIIDAESYYPFGVPFSTNVGDIRYMAKLGAATTSQIGKNKAIDIATYDGESRANLALTTTKYWSPLTASDVLVPGVGYIISAKRLKNETYAGLRFTLNVPDEWLTLGEQTSITIDETTVTRNVVSVGAWQNDNTHIGHWGWNYVANPYLVDVNGFTANFLTDDGDQIRYLTIPSFRFEDYYQIPTAIGTVESFNGFFVQVGGSNSTITFNQDLRQRTPARYASAMEKEQQIYIAVSGNTESDLMGLIINDCFTADYDFNADLVKEMVEGGSSLRCYMRYNDFNMAYLALNKTLLDESIPVAVRFPQDSYYTFSLNEHSITNNMKAVYLYDKTTGSTTDLLSSDYNFQSEKGLITDRFALFAVSESSEVPTFISNTDDGSPQTPEKFIYNGHLYFSHGGMIFDGQGKCVK